MAGRGARIRTHRRRACYQGGFMDIQQNKQLVMEGYRLFQRGDIQGLLDRYHESAEWIGPASEFVPFAGSFHGKAEIGRFFALLDAAVKPLHFEPQKFIAEGDTVVVTGTSSWMARQTGRSYDSPWVHVFELQDGKVMRFQSYFDTGPAERALHAAQPGQLPTAAELHH
jgi:ketosteroid isomerase-like protein